MHWGEQQCLSDESVLSVTGNTEACRAAADRVGSQEVAAVTSVNLFSLCSKDLPKDPVVSNHRVPGHEAPPEAAFPSGPR